MTVMRVRVTAKVGAGVDGRRRARDDVMISELSHHDRMV